MRRLAIWLVTSLAGCNTERTVAPVIDTPAGDTEATAADLDDITLAVAHAGNSRDLVSQSFGRGASVELTGAPFGDDLVIHMTGFVGTSDVAYGRTCAFTVSSGGEAPSPHLFFSRTVKFADAQVLDGDDQNAAPMVRVGGVAIPYLGGALLLDGVGVNLNGADGQPLDAGERYDPATNRLVPFGPMIGRTGGAHALLGDGSKVVVLGGSADGRGGQIMEVIDGTAVSQISFPGAARADLTATQLTDGEVLVVGGQSANVASGEIDQVDPSDSAVIVRKLDAQLHYARHHHTATRLGDELGAPVLIAGGIGTDGMPVAGAELFDPLDSGLSVTFTHAMSTPRSGHRAARLPDGSVLFIGGVDTLGRPVFTLERFTREDGFTPVINSLPTDAGVIDAAIVTLPDGRILLTGGRSTVDGQPVNTAYIIRLDPVDGMIDVIATDHMSVARAGHQMATLCDGTVWISGGASSTSVERYNPPADGRR